VFLRLPVPKLEKRNGIRTVELWRARIGTIIVELESELGNGNQIINGAVQYDMLTVLRLAFVLAFGTPIIEHRLLRNHQDYYIEAE
jgi:hypothetical protein